jgi:formylglycine-generating enzyme required for sulfatase activity
LELEADKWAGSTLYQLGATLEQALSCFESVSMKGSQTHPARDLRKQAMQTGWYEAKAENPAPVPKPTPAPSPAKRDFTETATGASFSMKFISGNSFSMGSNDGESDEKPVHTVRVSDFHMGKYEVTFAEYDKFCDATSREKPSDAGWGRGNRPVINVSWDDATAYCKWLSSTTGKSYRLPTEAEWEYSARGGQNYKYAGSDDWNAVAWNGANSDSKTHPVGQKQANGFGLYDMSGNVWEWCSDWKRDYSSRTETNPTGAATGSGRVYRGGSWFSGASSCRASSRYDGAPAYRDSHLGFRLVLSLQ